MCVCMCVCVWSSAFSMKKIISSALKRSFISFFPNWIYFIYFSYLIVLVGTFSGWIDVVKESICSLLLIFEEMLLVLHHWLWWSLCVLHIWVLLCWGSFLLLVCWIFFYHERVLDFVTWFLSISWDDPVCLVFVFFFLHSFYIVFYVHQFLYVEQSLNSWNKPTWTWCNSFNILLNSIC